MKKILSFAFLVLICTNSFGQSVTNMNFTGMLAKTTFAQFSLTATNNTIATANSSFITAIAGPNVDVANITDMVLTISTGSTLVTAQSTTGAPISTTTVPTNYTGSEQPLSGFVFSTTKYAGVYAGNAAGDRYRGINIFIHKLIPAPLPIVVPSNNVAVQPGFAQCAEIANSGTNVQLHTNDQAIYLAFTSAADVVKFQYENVGTTTADPDAAIVVEKSADLVTWTSIQSIDIANQGTATKVDFSAEVNDAAARYIRIRITGLANSRSNRRENIRNIAVMNGSLGTASNAKEKEINFIFVTREGIVSNIEGTLQVYAINGALLKNITVSKNQVIPVDKGQYIVRTTINGKSISKLIVK